MSGAYVVHLTEELPMLVLSRKAGEQIHIGEDIVVTVLEVQGQRIRLGIDAPTDVPVRRAELSFSFADDTPTPFPARLLADRREG